MDNLSEFIQDIQFWHWWILGVLLLGLEMVVAGTFFLWMGVSAGVVGVILLLFPEFGWQNQVFVFAVLSVVTVVGWRMWSKEHPVETADPTLNVRGAQYVGRVFSVAEPVVDGVGKAKVGDSLWRIALAGDGTLAEGTRVRVTGVEGATLLVEPAE